MRTTTLSRNLWRSIPAKQSIFIILVFAAIGTYMLMRSFAATPNVSSEVELGTPANGAVVVNDSTASAGKAAAFRNSNPGGGGGQTGVPTRQNGWWWADFAGAPLGSMGCRSSSGTATANAVTKQWDYWDNCGGSVVSVASEGIPQTPWGGSQVVKWHKPAGDNANTYQKLNLTLTKNNWPLGSAGPSVPNAGSPADVSGRYIVYQYIPSAKFQLNPSHGWVILNEFKENYNDSGGTWRQDPAWQFGCNNFSGGGVTCSLSPHTSPRFALSPYMDRWVKWEMRLYQGAKDTSGRGGRIEFYADDKLLDTGYNSERRVGSGTFGPLSNTLAWVWIAGQYTSNQTTNGTPDSQNTNVTSYVGLSTILPLP